MQGPMMLQKHALGTHKLIGVGLLTYKPMLDLLQRGKRENKVSGLPNVPLVKVRSSSTVC